jgi:hypothetical protein
MMMMMTMTMTTTMDNDNDDNAGAPYQARNLSVRAIDANTVEVTWSPGFNGGAKQQFLLEYLKQVGTIFAKFCLTPGEPN